MTIENLAYLYETHNVGYYRLYRLYREKLINTRTGKVEVGSYNSSELQIIKGILNPPGVKEDKVVFKNREIKGLERR